MRPLMSAMCIPLERSFRWGHKFWPYDLDLGFMKTQTSTFDWCKNRFWYLDNVLLVWNNLDNVLLVWNHFRWWMLTLWPWSWQIMLISVTLQLCDLDLCNFNHGSYTWSVGFWKLACVFLITCHSRWDHVRGHQCFTNTSCFRKWMLYHNLFQADKQI